MKPAVLIFFILLLSFGSCAEVLPDDSIYHIGSNWNNQDKVSVEIEQLRGHIQVIAFIYTYCQHSCPIIMERLKQIEKHLSAEQKEAVHFSLFSLDPKRDTPKELKAFEKKHQLDAQYWSFYNGDPESVLELAALVGVRYKPMNNDNNDIAHSNMITLLDQQGRIIHQVKGFGEDLDTVLNVIKSTASPD